ncbi:hypothetical protein GMD78_14075 [Ornithinibacillus sp. L9]|uniref:Uncharacterized protein n=1 Tax=Ornithinibacillus caprae TaxID=2678566 RepID=A0A6N8FJW8_9BACI|nr:hypothetical protein [Ornithinibacillus caprae]
MSTVIVVFSISILSLPYPVMLITINFTSIRTFMVCTPNSIIRKLEFCHPFMTILLTRAYHFKDMKYALSSKRRTLKDM